MKLDATAVHHSIKSSDNLFNSCRGFLMTFSEFCRKRWNEVRYITAESCSCTNECSTRQRSMNCSLCEITTKRSEKLSMSLNNIIGVQADADRAIAHFEITRDRSSTKIDPTTKMAVAEKSSVCLIGKIFYHRGDDFTGDTTSLTDSSSWPQPRVWINLCSRSNFYRPIKATKRPHRDTFVDKDWS